MKSRLFVALCTLTLLASPAAAEEVLLGLYYDRAHDGHGYELHKVGDLYVLYFYTFEDSGDPEKSKKDSFGEMCKFKFHRERNPSHPTMYFHRK